MIRDLLEQLAEDPWRQSHPFSEDMRVCQEVLFRPGATQSEMEQALNEWLAKEQPCLFGQMEAKQERLAYCLLTENDLHRGDVHVRARIREDRRLWRQRALDGGSHGFIIVAISPQIAWAAVGPDLLRLARHLCGLYLMQDYLDTIYHDSLLLKIQRGTTERREWRVGVNFFSAQGDGRWWRDHRFPGGIAYSMNSVGHMARHKAEELLRKNAGLAAGVANVPRDRLVFWALPTAMKTIGVPESGSTRGTWLVERGKFPEDKDPPTYEVRERVFGDLVRFSENRYHGTYHTDETIPSPYFDPRISTLEQATLRDDLYFTYLHSPADPDYLTMGIGTLAQLLRGTKRRDTPKGGTHDGPDHASPHRPGRRVGRQPLHLGRADSTVQGGPRSVLPARLR